MKTKVLKTLALLMAAVLLVTATVLATMAYLTSTSAVSNVFTVGDVKIQMFETKVDKDGVSLNEPLNDGMKTADTNSYHLVPGKSYLKDPTVYVEANCDLSYLFVRVRNDLKSIEKGGDATPTIVDQLLANGWYEIERAASNVDAVFVYVGDNTKEDQADGKGGTVSAPKAKLVGGTSTRQSYDVFQSFTIKDKMDSGVSLQAFGGARVAIVAYAIQADLSGFTTEQKGTYEAYKSAWEYIKAELPFVV